MRPSLHRLRQRVALASGLYVTPHTSPVVLREFARSLHPVATDIDLVRLGPKDDGGYLVPDDLDGVTALMSPGIGPVSGFDEAVADHGIPVYMADGSVACPAVSHPLFHCTQRDLGGVDSADVMTLDTWVNKVIDSDTAELMLQMDIESAEYLVIPTISEELLCRFRIIVVEFHRLNQLWEPFFFRVTSAIFTKLLRHHFCVHVHPNNNGGVYRHAGLEIPKAMEFTFIRKDRARVLGVAREFPHPLDVDNVSKPPVILPPMWHAA